MRTPHTRTSFKVDREAHARSNTLLTVDRTRVTIGKSVDVLGFQLSPRTRRRKDWFLESLHFKPNTHLGYWSKVLGRCMFCIIWSFGIAFHAPLCDTSTFSAFLVDSHSFPI